MIDGFWKKSENLFSFVGCDFEQDEDSKSPIYIIKQEFTNNVEVLDCKFEGEMKNDSHYVDEVLDENEILNAKSFIYDVKKKLEKQNL